MKLTRSRIIAAVAFLCLLAGSLEIYDPVVPKGTGEVLSAIEETTSLPVRDWLQTLTDKPIPRAPSGKARKPSLVDAAMDKMLEQKEVEQASKEQITLKDVKFEGVTILSDMELRGIVEPFLRTPMNFEQMLEIGMVVENYYRQNNYLARAVLPPQDLSAGILTIDVIESVFSKIEIEQELEDLPNTQNQVTAIIEAQQKPGDILNSKSLDRGLALANELPGINVQGSLRQGRDAGETELLLKMYQGRTRQAELNIDNGGSRSTGAVRLMATLNLFNPNDIGDLLNLVAVHTRGSDYARLAYSVPVGTDGWRMGVNASAMKYEVVIGDQGMVGAVGKAMTQGLEWVYPLLRADDRSATLTLSADTKQFQNTSAQGLVMSDYAAKVLTAQVAGFHRDLNPGGGSGTYSAQISHGNINLDGSLSQQTDKSTVQTEGEFNKIRLNATWQQSLTAQTSAFVSYTGQLSDKNLDSSEKMQLGGMNGVRAYPTGEGSGSDAQLIQLELRHQLESGINMSAFYDWGQVNLQHNPDYPGGPTNNRNIYKGFGASIGYTYEDGMSIKATWARKIGNNPNPNPVTGNDQDGTRDRNRYWLQLNLPF